MSAALAHTVAATLNHLLASAPWARQALLRHSGQTAAFALPPVEVVLTVAADGSVRAATPGAVADLRIALTPGTALRVLAGDLPVAQAAHVEGDTGFAATVRLLAQHLRWDYEEDMSRVLGDVLAHRAAAGLRAVAALPADARRRLARAGVEYATEEVRLLPPKAEVEVWLAAVDELRDAVERLDKRLDLLERGRA